jgi:SpoVK/Ycf46/Vps4 family AAA+-type ATPase
MTYIAPFESLKYTLTSYFKTGNIIIDTLITTLLLSFLSYSSSYKSSIIDFLKKLKRLFFDIETNEVSFNCTELSSTFCRAGKIKMHGSDSFKAILLDIKDNINKGKTEGLWKIREFCGDKDDHLFEEDKKNFDESIKDIIYLVDQDEDFKINNKNTEELLFSIKVTTSDFGNESKSSATGKHIIYTLTIKSKTKSLEYIQKYINLTLDKYLEIMNHKINNNQFVFIYEGIDSDNGSLEFTTYPFDTTCNINNIYFDNKVEIMKQIDFFKDNKKWYETNGKPYTLGICSHGPPGCGKTSFEKSLAKYLNRHIIIVDLNKIETQREADKLFFSEKINSKIIPYDKRIYLFPDIDAMGSLVTSREKKEKKEEKEDELIDKLITNYRTKNVSKMDDEVIKILDEYDKQPPKSYGSSLKDPLNLSKFLNILDGIPERTGQILIFNTNYPDKLDEALLRPGRVDCLIHFQKLNTENIIKMVNNYFADEKNKKTKQQIMKEIEKCNRYWTPAEIFQICSKFNDINEVYSILKKCTKIHSIEL